MHSEIVCGFVYHFEVISSRKNVQFQILLAYLDMQKLAQLQLLFPQAVFFIASEASHLSVCTFLSICKISLCSVSAFHNLLSYLSACSLPPPRHHD